jgi:hypothetical protein
MVYAALVVQLEFPEVKETRKAGQSCFLESHYLSPSPKWRKNYVKIELEPLIACQFSLFTFRVFTRRPQRREFWCDVLRIRFEVGNTKIACEHGWSLCTFSTCVGLNNE